MGRDPAHIIQSSISIVSIHAPTWGATKLIVRSRSSLIVSIHAPTWGATPDFVII